MSKQQDIRPRPARRRWIVLLQPPVPTGLQLPAGGRQGRASLARPPCVHARGGLLHREALDRGHRPGRYHNLPRLRRRHRHPLPTQQQQGYHEEQGKVNPTRHFNPTLLQLISISGEESPSSHDGDSHLRDDRVGPPGQRQ